MYHLDKALENDGAAITTLLVAFTANLLEAISHLDLSAWITIGTAVLALVLGIFKMRVFYYDALIKKKQYQDMEKEEADESHS